MLRRRYAWAFLVFVALHVLTPGRYIGLIELRAVFSRAAPQQPLPDDDRHKDAMPGLDVPFGKTVVRHAVDVRLIVPASVLTLCEPIPFHLSFIRITGRLPLPPAPSPRLARAPPLV